jgi:hypothetical protein
MKNIRNANQPPPTDTVDYYLRTSWDIVKEVYNKLGYIETVADALTGGEAFVLHSEIDSLAGLNTVVADATLIDITALDDYVLTTTLTANYSPTSAYATVAFSGDSDDLVEGATNLLLTTAERAKLTDIEANATADQTDAEIETAYNNQVAVVTQPEAEAGTLTTVKRWTPERVKQAIAALGGGGGGGGMTVTTVKTANYTAAENEVVPVDSSGGTAFTITMPASASAQSRVIVIDVGKACGTYPVTLGRNSQTFDGVAEDFVIDQDNGRVDAVSDGAGDFSTHLVGTPNLVGGGRAITASDSLTEFNTDNQSVTGFSTTTILNVTSGGCHFFGGVIIGPACSVKITLDGTVIIDQITGATFTRGDDVGGGLTGVFPIPEMYAETSLKIEFYLNSSSAKDCGWRGVYVT